MSDTPPLASNVPIVNPDGTPTLAFLRLWQLIAAGTSGITVNDTDIVMHATSANNATTLHHGFLPQLPGIAGEFLSGNGNWLIPAGGGSGAFSVDGNDIEGEGGQLKFDFGALEGITVTDGVKGQITVSSGGTIWSLNASTALQIPYLVPAGASEAVGTSLVTVAAASTTNGIAVDTTAIWPFIPDRKSVV